ncbi:MAG: MMPL family transporter [Proteobacteria bacterium]|nr:MMPL family transporter [Pseudomonadota bacterium]
MEKYFDFILNRPVIVLVILLVITLFLAPGIPKLEFDNSVDVMMPKNDIRYVTNEKIKNTFGNIGKFIIINVTGPNLLSKDFFSQLASLSADIEEYHDYNPRKEETRLHILTGMSEKSPLAVAELLEAVKDDPPLKRFIEDYATHHQLDKTSKLEANAFSDIVLSFETSLALKKQELVENVISVVNAQDLSGKDDTLETVDLIEKDGSGDIIFPETAGDFDVLKRKLFHNPAFENSLYVRDPHTGEITDLSLIVRIKNVQKDDILGEEIWKIAFSYPELHPTLQGVPIVNKFMNDYMTRDIRHFMPLVMLVVLIVFYLNFRSLRGVFLPLTGLALADIWILGLMGHLGINITIIGVSLPSLMIAIGSSYAIHILNQYYIDFDMISRVGKKEGLKISMFHISVTVFLAGVTTFFGFLSLQTNQVTGIREWGLFSAIGIIFAVIISTSLIPAGLVLMRHRESNMSKKLFGSTGKTWIDPLLKFLTRLTIKHHKAVVAVMLVTIIAAVMGLLQLRVETDILSYFKEKDYMRTSARLIGEKYGGSVGLNILIDSGEVNGVLTPEYLKWLNGFTVWLTSDDNMDLNVGKVFAFTDIIKTMHMAMNNDEMSYYKIPDSRDDILDYIELYSGDDQDSDGRVDDFESFVDIDFRKALVFAKLWEKSGYIIGTHEIEMIQNKISDYLTRKLPAGYTFQITGEPTLLVALSDYVVRGQLTSLFFCLIAVGIIVILLFKNVKAGFLALIPMGFAVIVNFGIMGWFNINLDTATAIIASVAIGIGIDDTIHFLNTYRFFRTESCSMDEAITKTIAISGKAICYTSIALVFGFSVMIVSNFKPLVLVGLLNGITMISTTLGALVILPSVIKATNMSLAPSPSKGIFWRMFYIGRLFNLKA